MQQGNDPEFLSKSTCLKNLTNLKNKVLEWQKKVLAKFRLFHNTVDKTDVAT